MLRTFIFLLTTLVALPAMAESIRVGVAISLKEAMEEIAQAYQKQSPDKVEFTFGSSGQLAAQIKNGAAIDVFISAAQKQVDDLAKEKLLTEDAPRIVAHNALVLVVPADSDAGLKSMDDLRDTAIRRIAIGDPKTVPAGQYAMQALERLKLFDLVKDRLIYGTNVRQVLSYVERGEVNAGLVYATDAKQSGDKVRVVATAPPESHDQIVYPAAIVNASRHHEAARRWLDYLAIEDARTILRNRGFVEASTAK